MNPFILLSAAAASGFYLLNVPLIAALAAGAGGVGWSFGAFVPAGAVRRAERKAAGIGKKPKKRARPRPPLRTIFAPAKYLLRHTEFLVVSVSGVLSTGDAMRTALAVGALNTLAAIPGSHVVSRVHPDFSGAPMRVEAEAACSVSLGCAMGALCLWLMECMKERFKAWKSSQSKT